LGEEVLADYNRALGEMSVKKSNGHTRVRVHRTIDSMTDGIFIHVKVQRDYYNLV